MEGKNTTQKINIGGVRNAEGKHLQELTKNLEKQRRKLMSEKLRLLSFVMMILMLVASLPMYAFAMGIDAARPKKSKLITKQK
ncbi:MAG: hypothetical protein IJX51_01705 [Clostridia bacterium]|nr:hypothetical protein [Clostridia bacterium]